MKRFLLTAVLVVTAAVGLRAQDVQITNISGCTITAKAYYGNPCLPAAGFLPPVTVPSPGDPIYLTAPEGMIILYVEILDFRGVVIGTYTPPSTSICPGYGVISGTTAQFSSGCPCAGAAVDGTASDGCGSCPTGGWVLEIY